MVDEPAICSDYWITDYSEVKVSCGLVPTNARNALVLIEDVASAKVHSRGRNRRFARAIQTVPREVGPLVFVTA
jgi:hypothetical protein